MVDFAAHDQVQFANAGVIIRLCNTNDTTLQMRGRFGFATDKYCNHNKTNNDKPLYMFYDIFNSIHITIRDVIVNVCAKSNGDLVIIKIEIKASHC